MFIPFIPFRLFSIPNSTQYVYLLKQIVPTFPNVCKTKNAAGMCSEYNIHFPNLLPTLKYAYYPLSCNLASDR